MIELNRNTALEESLKIDIEYSEDNNYGFIIKEKVSGEKITAIFNRCRIYMYNSWITSEDMPKYTSILNYVADLAKQLGE